MRAFLSRLSLAVLGPVALPFFVSLCLGLTVGLTPALAQEVTGRITDAVTGEPLPQATVAVRGTGTGVAANDRGRYRLRLPAPGPVVLVFRHLGYRTRTERAELEAGRAVTVDAALVPETLSGDELLIEGRMDPLTAEARSTETLSAAALAEVRGQSLGETLATLPGVTTLQTGPSISKPVIRGLHSSRVVVLSHGIPQEGQQWGGEHAPAIDPFAPAEITVVKGAAGVEHGAGAIGGVVKLEPHPLPEAPGLDGSLDLNGFSNSRQGAGSLRLEGGVSGLQGAGWRLLGSLRRAGDAHSPSGVIGNSAFAEQHGALTLGLHREAWGVEAHAGRFHTDLGIYQGAHVNTVSALERILREGTPPSDGFSYSIDAPKQSVTHDLATVRAHWDAPAGHQWSVQYGVQRNHRQEFDAHCRFCDDPGAEPAFDLTLWTHTVDAKVRSRAFTVQGGDAVLTAGLHGMNQGNENGERGYLIPNFRALTGGAFLRTSWMRGPWTVDAGTRADARRLSAFPQNASTGDFSQTTTRYTGLSAVAGVIRRIGDTWSLGMNASTAWRPPSVNELYSDGVHHGSAQYEVGTAGLNGERMWGLDATLRHAGSRVRLQTSAYSTWARDFIQLVPTAEPVVTIRGVFPAFVYGNTDARLLGLDGSVEVDPVRRLTLGATAALVRGDDRTAGRPLFGMPADRATLFGTVHLPGGPRVDDASLRLETTLVRTQTRHPDALDFAPAPDGYALFGARAGATLHVGPTPVRLGLSIHNLLNTTYRDLLSRYRYYVDAPGRTVVVRVHVPLGDLRGEG